MTVPPQCLCDVRTARVGVQGSQTAIQSGYLLVLYSLSAPAESRARVFGLSLIVVFTA